MRKILAVSILFFASSAYAYDVWLSSTPVAATASLGVAKLCDAYQRGIFHGICTDYGVAAASTTIVASTYTLTGVRTIGPISTFVADQCKYFDLMTNGGLGYNKPNSAVVTILYQCR